MICRIGDQIDREIVVDREALDQEHFVDGGAYERLNCIFDGHLAELISSELNDVLWCSSA